MTATLIIGKPFSGKHDLLMKMLKKEKRDILYVTTTKTPEEFKSIFGRKNIHFIDTYTLQSGIHEESSHAIRRVPSPVALTEILIEISEFEAEHGPYVLVLDSLSTLLLYTNCSTVTRFLQVLLLKVRKHSSDSIFLMEGGMHDDKVVTTIEHLMDRRIETKKDGRSFKLREVTKERHGRWESLRA